MKYYFAGYYLIKINKANYGSILGQEIHTCSTCINDSLLNSWSYSWTDKSTEEIDEAEQVLGITSDEQKEIQNWVEKKEELKEVAWINVFSDLAVAKAYRSNFFSHLPDVEILSVYFPESEANDFLEEFKPQKKEYGTLGLWDNLSKKVEEDPSSEAVIVGYDLIGVEWSGNFHTFHCHDLAKDLKEKFNVSVNQHGLLDKADNWQEIVGYMNNEENGFEPVPWFFVKVSLSKNTST